MANLLGSDRREQWRKRLNRLHALNDRAREARDYRLAGRACFALRTAYDGNAREIFAPKRSLAEYRADLARAAVVDELRGPWGRVGGLAHVSFGADGEPIVMSVDVNSEAAENWMRAMRERSDAEISRL